MQLKEREKEDKVAEQKQLKQGIEFILEECRMVLPGLQALFGFELISVFNEPFHQLGQVDKDVHLAAILFTLMSVSLLMAPAAYHRLTRPDGIPKELITVGTNLVCAGMATMLISLVLEIYIITKEITDHTATGIIFGAFTFIFFASVWYVFPLMTRRALRHRKHSVDLV